MTELLGTMHRLDDTRATVRVEDVYDADIHDLWSAVTEPERLSRWLAEVDGDPQLGATVYARFTSGWEGPVRIDEKAHFYGAGWQAHIEDLRRSLVGDESEWKDRWTELTPAYAELPVS